MSESDEDKKRKVAEGLRIAAGGGACAMGCLAIFVVVAGALLLYLIFWAGMSAATAVSH